MEFPGDGENKQGNYGPEKGHVNTLEFFQF